MNILKKVSIIFGCTILTSAIVFSGYLAFDNTLDKYHKTANTTKLANDYDKTITMEKWISFSKIKYFFNYDSSTKTIQGILFEKDLKKFFTINNIDSIYFDESVENIDVPHPEFFLNKIPNLKRIAFKNIKTISPNAFFQCESLISVDFGYTKSLTIEKGAFFKCKNLSSLKINKDSKIIKLGEQAFSFCNLNDRKNIEITNENLNGNGCWIGDYSKNAWIINKNGDGCLGGIAFGDIDISCINKDKLHCEGFKGCVNITNITKFPSSVTSIGTSCFSGCEKLKNINFENNKIVFFDYLCFEECYSLEKIILPCSSSKIFFGDYCFIDCKNLKKFSLLNNFSNDLNISIYFGKGVFLGCSILEYVLIAKNFKFKYFGEKVFSECSSLKSRKNIEITNENLDGIGYWVGDSENAWVISKDSYGCVGSLAFGNIDISSLKSWSEKEIEENDLTTEISEKDFSSCYSIKSIKMKRANFNVPYCFFNNCLNLEQVYFDCQDLKLFSGSFQTCRNLSLFSLSENSSITKIGSYIFGKCNKLNSKSCFKISNFNIETLGKWIIKDNWNAWIVKKEKNGCLGGIAFGKIDASILTSISRDAFAGSYNLKNIILPKDITEIGKEAFFDCVSLEDIFIPDKVETLCEDAFYDCINLQSFYFSPFSNLKKIEFDAFYNCISLKNVFLPDNLNKIEHNTFFNCNNLYSVTFLKTYHCCYSLEQFKNKELSIAPNAFSECKKLTFLNLGEKYLEGKPLFENELTDEGIGLNDVRMFEDSTEFLILTGKMAREKSEIFYFINKAISKFGGECFYIQI